MKTYTAVRITCPPPVQELLIAELSSLEYDSFLEEDTYLEAYVEQQHFEEADVKQLLSKYQLAPDAYAIQTVAPQNWNALWESNFEPITVEDQCLVRATFHHISKPYPYEIIINPKMSFGTGHHATTYLMLSWQLEIDHHQKRVMDAGCGTGILAIMAHQRGATKILAFDIDEWPVENSQENFALNHCPNIQLFQGTVADVPRDQTFDLILANINRNVLLSEIPTYAQHLSPGGHLLLSGFYETDTETITHKAHSHRLTLTGQKAQNQWAALHFQKI